MNGGEVSYAIDILRSGVYGVVVLLAAHCSIAYQFCLSYQGIQLVGTCKKSIVRGIETDPIKTPKNPSTSIL
jgi:hypothetical protein